MKYNVKENQYCNEITLNTNLKKSLTYIIMQLYWEKKAVQFYNKFVSNNHVNFKKVSLIREMRLLMENVFIILTLRL